MKCFDTAEALKHFAYKSFFPPYTGSSSDAMETPGEGEVIEEMAPLPHPLGGKQEEGTTRTHTPGTFPELNSSLLQVGVVA